VDTAKKVLEVIDSTIDFLEQVSDLSSSGVIHFGDFNLTEKFIEDPKAATTGEDVKGAKSGSELSSQMSADQKKMLAGPDQKGLDKTGKTSGTKKTSGPGRPHVAPGFHPRPRRCRAVLLRPAGP